MLGKRGRKQESKQAGMCLHCSIVDKRFINGKMIFEVQVEFVITTPLFFKPRYTPEKGTTNTDKCFNFPSLLISNKKIRGRGNASVNLAGEVGRLL